ncbi:MAG TPA: hypothetical protein VN455_12210 [Methanotrichaceae archaeon]|nr:hypothetical protein [Methanotrichaceae archaeon]
MEDEKVKEMKTEYLTGPMQQYEKWAEESIVRNKPKYQRPYGIKRPDSTNIMAVATGVFIILVAAAHIL